MVCQSFFSVALKMTDNGRVSLQMQYFPAASHNTCEPLSAQAMPAHYRDIFHAIGLRLRQGRLLV